MGDFLHYFVNGFGDGLYFLLLFVAAFGLHVIPRNLTWDSKSPWWECFLWGIVGSLIIAFFAYALFDCHRYGPGGWYDEMQELQCSNEMSPERARHAGKIFIIGAMMIGTGIYNGWCRRGWKSSSM